MSPANISRIENGEQGPPDDEVIIALAEALGADADELLELAGRSMDPNSFERAVLRELHALREAVARIEAALADR